jgi:2,3-diketo-5-methylthio-1-phosphopentane phosphatase
MNDFVFISDFDGTITKKDFYWILLDDYIGQKGIDYYKEWKKTKKIGTEFLNKVFTWHTFTDEERRQALNKVDIDEKLPDVIEEVKKQGGDFVILSAGFRYYIDYVLKQDSLDKIPVYTNEGSFKDNTFVMEPDKNSPYYSEIYGIDKEKVALEHRKKYKKVYFAGDSEPDYKAAICADVIFAKDELARLLDESGRAYIKYSSFEDILEYLK